MISWQDNSKLTYDEWLVARLNTIGASEVAVVVAGTKYMSSLELFYEKIGAPKKKISNLRTFIGKETEELSATMWKYFSGTDQSIVDNFERGNQIKECTHINSTAFNSDYPYLSVTPDRRIEPFGIYAGKGYGSLEIKNTNSWVLKSYETGIPPENAMQLASQMMVCDWNYGELFYFIDNKSCECYPIERSEIKHIEETIQFHCNRFWDSVIEGRKVYNRMFECKRNMNQRGVDECVKELYRLEPPVQNTESYLSFLSEKYVDRLAGVGVIPGTPEQKQIALKHKELEKQKKAIANEQLSLEIALKNAIGDMSVLDFGKEGKVTWITGSNGSRKFSNKIK